MDKLKKIQDKFRVRTQSSCRCADFITQWKPVNMTIIGPWNTGRIRTWFSEKKTTESLYVCGQIMEALRARFLGTQIWANR